MQNPTRQFGTLPPVHILVDGPSANHELSCSTATAGAGIRPRGPLRRMSYPTPQAWLLSIPQETTVDGPLARSISVNIVS